MRSNVDSLGWLTLYMWAMTVQGGSACAQTHGVEGTRQDDRNYWEAELVPIIIVHIERYGIFWEIEKDKNPSKI